MTDKDWSALDRRSILKITGAAGLTGLAGCTGGGGGGGGDGGDGGDGGGDGGGGDGGGGGGDGGTDFPTEPMTWVVPYGTAGGYNFYTRLVAKYLEQKDYLPVQQRVENVTGAGGIVAANQVYNAEPDGYTNMIMNTETFAISQIVRDVDFDLENFTYYGRIAGTTRAIAVGAQTDITTGEELIDATAAGELTYGNEGRTSETALMVIVLGEIAGFWTGEDYREWSVPYEGRGEEVTAIKNGDIQAMTGSFSSLLPFVESGDLRIVMTYIKEDSCPDGTQNADCDTFASVDKEIPRQDEIIALSGGPFHRIFGGPPDVPEERAQIIADALGQAINDEDLQAEAAEADRPITYADRETTRQGALNTINAYRENRDLLEKAGMLG